MDSKHCIGCREDFYNGKNDLGVKKCWGLRIAQRILRVRVHINERPPWTAKPVMLPNCYRDPGYVFVLPDNPSCQQMKTERNTNDRLPPE